MRKQVLWSVMAMKSLSSFLPKITEQTLGKKGLLHAKLLTNWKEIIGHDRARYCQPSAIDFKPAAKEKGGKFIGAKLTIASTSAFAPMLEMERDLLRERINRYFGYNAIHSLRIVHNLVIRKKDVNVMQKKMKDLTPEAKERLASIVQKIDDPDLQAALLGFGTALYQDQDIDA